MSRPCVLRIDDAGLATRTQVAVDRERRMAPQMVLLLEGRMGDPTGAEARLTMELLEEGFAKQELMSLPAAAFLAGRCDPGSDADREVLAAGLDGIIAMRPVDDLGAAAFAYVEAALSIGIGGEVDRGQALLRAIAGDGGRHTTHDWLAAAYLAELGDPSGFPALLATLRGTEVHNRLMATRNIVLFAAFDGDVVAGETVDIRGLLVERLDDDEVYVAGEVPGLLVEAGVPDAAELLQAAAAGHRHPEVRLTAEDTVADLSGA